MLLKDVKRAIEQKIQTSGGLKIPKDDSLALIVHEAMIDVATRTIPAKLVRNSFLPLKGEILRPIRDGRVIIVPEYPVFDDKRHMQIDTELDFAVINKACALLSKKIESIRMFELQATLIINRHKAAAIKIAQ